MLIRTAAFATIVTPVWALCLMSANVDAPATPPNDDDVSVVAGGDIPVASAAAWSVLAAVTCFTAPVCRGIARRAGRPQRVRHPRTLRHKIETVCGVRRVGRCPVLDAKRMTG